LPRSARKRGCGCRLVLIEGGKRVGGPGRGWKSLGWYFQEREQSAGLAPGGQSSPLGQSGDDRYHVARGQYGGVAPVQLVAEDVGVQAERAG
jgi:hypothetical protein